MRKFAIPIIAALALSGCSGGKLTQSHLHIQSIAMVSPAHFEIDSAIHRDGGLEAHSEKYGTIFVADGLYVLYSTDECPLCGKVTYR